MFIIYMTLLFEDYIMSMNIYSITNAEGQTLNIYDVNKKLEDLGIPDDIIEQGEAAIEDYASDNNIDLSVLQVEVKKSDKNGLSGSDKYAKEDFNAKLEASGIPFDVIEQGKDAVIAYADKNNITLPEPPKKGVTLNYAG